ncbi:hypothetical protein [Phage Phass-1]|uniref:Uncharacterized protein n=1 Tax=Phage Phass-1 TaxID=3043662 RepID=A0AAF0RU70_9CAUD|nr:hypothetical protein [Phage Phass-1]
MWGEKQQNHRLQYQPILIVLEVDLEKYSANQYLPIHQLHQGARYRQYHQKLLEVFRLLWCRHLQKPEQPYLLHSFANLQSILLMYPHLPYYQKPFSLYLLNYYQQNLKR